MELVVDVELVVAVELVVDVVGEGLVVFLKGDRYGDSSDDEDVDAELVVAVVVVELVPATAPTYGDGHCDARAFHSSGVRPIGMVQL